MIRPRFQTLIVASCVLWCCLRLLTPVQSASFDVNKHFTLTLALLIDQTGTIAVQSAADVALLMSIVRLWVGGSTSNFFVYHNTSSQSLIPLTVSLASNVRDTTCNQLTSIYQAAALVSTVYNTLAFVGPPCDAAASATTLVTSEYSLPQIGYGSFNDPTATNSNPTTTFSASNSAQSWMLETSSAHNTRAAMIVQVLLHYGWNYVTILASQTQFGRDMLYDLQQQAQYWNITVLTTYSFPPTIVDWSVLLQGVQMIQHDGGHIFVLASDELLCQTLLLELYQHNLIKPGFVYIAAGRRCIDTTLNNNSSSSTMFHQLQQSILPGIMFIDHFVDTTTSAYKVFLDDYLNLTSAFNDSTMENDNTDDTGAINDFDQTNSPSMEALLFFDTVMSLMHAFAELLYNGIVPSQSNGMLVRTALLYNVSFEGVTGHVEFSTIDGTRLGGMYIVRQFNATNGVAELGRGTVVQQSLTYDLRTIPVVAYIDNAQVDPFWPGYNVTVPQAYTPSAILSNNNSSTALSSRAINIIVTILVVGACFVLLITCMLLLWKRKMRRVMSTVKEAYKAKSQFLANMTHELRTPMNGVYGMTEELALTTLTSDQRECVQSLQISTRHLLSVVSDVLDFGKMESGKMELEVQPCDLVSLVDDAVGISWHEQYHHQQQQQQPSQQSDQPYQSHSEIVTFVDPSLPATINVDGTRLRQIITNLVSNAVKFGCGRDILVRVSRYATVDDHLYELHSNSEQASTIDVGRVYDSGVRWLPEERVEMAVLDKPTDKQPKRGVTASTAQSSAAVSPLSTSPSAVQPPSVELTIVVPHDTNVTVLLTVEDRGMGIPQGHLHKLFQSFSQSDSSISRRYGGTGLGLAISGRLVQMMRGRIWCESRVDCGTKFSVVLPLSSPVPDMITVAAPTSTLVEQLPFSDANGRSSSQATTTPLSRLSLSINIDTNTTDIVAMPAAPPLATLPSARIEEHKQVHLRPIEVLLVSPHRMLLVALASTMYARGAYIYTAETFDQAKAWLQHRQFQTQPQLRNASSNDEHNNNSSISHTNNNNNVNDNTRSGIDMVLIDALVLSNMVTNNGDNKIINTSLATLVGTTRIAQLVIVNLPNNVVVPASIEPDTRIRRPIKCAQLLRVLHQSSRHPKRSRYKPIIVRRNTESVVSSQKSDVDKEKERDDLKTVPNLFLAATGEVGHRDDRSVSAPASTCTTSNTTNGNQARIRTNGNVTGDGVNPLSLRVLYVEDNLVNQKVLVRMMNRLGYTVDLANDGVHALEILRDNASAPYDIVFMDLQMPRLDGYSTAACIASVYGQDVSAEEINKIDPAITIVMPPSTHVPIWPQSSVPPRKPVIIAVTANASTKDKQLSQMCRMDDYLTKPFTVQQLSKALHKWKQPAHSS